MHPIRILLAEDNGDHQELLRAALSRCGGDVEATLVRTGDGVLAAMRQRRARRFDCLVLDYNLPGFRADEILRKLTDRGMSCPVVVVSSSTKQDVVIRSMRVGCMDFVSKEEAITGTALYGSVMRAIRRHREENRERRRMERRARRLQRVAETDPLTGLTNRRYLERMVSGRRRHLDRRGMTACAFLDIDHFKHINDQHGHETGDRVLRATAHVLKASAPDDAVTCRWGGEEFVVILPDCSLGRAMIWAEGLRRRIAAEVTVPDERHMNVTVSCGLAVARSERFGHRTISQSDSALYLAKQRGRNQVCTWPMVAMERLLDDMGCGWRSSMRGRIEWLLNQSDGMLGDVQREHVGSHARRVEEICDELACDVGLHPEDQQRLRLAARYHDLGMVLVPEDILGKADALSTEERAIVDDHAAIGARISARLGADEQVGDYIRHHHSRFDRGGESIPVGGRILAVAEAFAGMTAPQPYRGPIPRSEAIRELQKESGRRFDPSMVDLLVERQALTQPN